MSSSAPVRSANSSSWALTVSGDPTALIWSIAGLEPANCAGSTGGWILRWRPLRMSRNICCSVVNCRRASSSVSATITLMPAITCGSEIRAVGASVLNVSR